MAAPVVAANADAVCSVTPKTGALDGKAKEFLAFPMYGSALWLVWVLVEPIGERGTINLGRSSSAHSLAHLAGPTMAQSAGRTVDSCWWCLLYCLDSSPLPLTGNSTRIEATDDAEESPTRRGDRRGACKRFASFCRLYC